MSTIEGGTNTGGTNTGGLTLEDINQLLATTRTKGEYKPVLARFFESEDLYMNLTERFPGKKVASLKLSIKLNLEKHFSDRDAKVITVGDADGEQAVLLVNMTVHAAQKAEAAAA